MSDATKRMRDFLTKSPSVVFPDEVLELFIPVEEENAKLLGLLEAVLQCAGETKRDKGCDACPMYNGHWRNDGRWCLLRPTLRKLGIEVK